MMQQAAEGISSGTQPQVTLTCVMRSGEIFSFGARRRPINQIFSAPGKSSTAD